MTTRHDNGILFVLQTNQTLCLRIVSLVNSLLSLVSIIFVLQSVNRFDFKWQSVDQNNLLINVTSIDVLVSISLENDVSEHGKLFSLILVVDRNDHRVVVLD